MTNRLSCWHNSQIHINSIFCAFLSFVTKLSRHLNISLKWRLKTNTCSKQNGFHKTAFVLIYYVNFDGNCAECTNIFKPFRSQLKLLFEMCIWNLSVALSTLNCIKNILAQLRHLTIFYWFINTWVCLFVGIRHLNSQFYENH